jgi:hypothetical protein
VSLKFTVDEARQKLTPYVAEALAELADQIPLIPPAAVDVLADVLTRKLLRALQDGLLGEGYALDVAADRVVFSGFDTVPEIEAVPDPADG